MRGLFVLFSALLLACAGASSAPPLPEHGSRVLIIGNSLTYVNDLPGTLERLSQRAGDTLVVRAVAGPDLAVIDHALGLTNANAVLRATHWDVVVLQQGPTPSGLDRDTLVRGTTLLDPLIRAAGARSVSLMTWPSSQQEISYPNLFDQTRESCRIAAASVQGACVQAGEAFRAAWARMPSLALRGPDGYHPAPLGTYLVALVLFESITHRDVRTLPSAELPPGIAAGDATTQVLRDAAHAAASR